MGQPCARMNDMSTGHQVWPPNSAMLGGFTVLINGRPAHRMGDMWMVHCAPPPVLGCHPSVCAGGSDTVISEGMPQARVGDSIACSDTIMTGSFDVLAG